MDLAPLHDGLRFVDLDDPTDDVPDEDGMERERTADPVLETLRDAFVDGFNARDVEALMGLVRPDVDCPDLPGEGVAALAEEVEAIWERSPAVFLTRAFLDDRPCAVAWLPDEDACWSRAALVCLEVEDGAICLVMLPDDADALDRAVAEDPSGDSLEEWTDWAEWDRGEESLARPRDRPRP